MMSDDFLEQLVEPLLTWYEANKRSLPWREDPTPYRVWVSEVMLQQTRVETVKPYFTRFLSALPDIPALAACPEDQLLKLWEGLGYYRRVRNMQAAARVIVAEYGGHLPADPDALRALPGIGPYIAGAISSIAFGLPVPAVDGNVLRVLARVTADESDITRAAVRTETERRLAPIIPRDRAGAFTQALMELGATVCLPNGEPLCHECPWQDLCEGRRRGIATRLPVKQPPKQRRVEQRTILLLCDGTSIALARRPETGLLAGMYELPGRDGHLTEAEVIREVKAMGLTPQSVTALGPARHVFSHVEWDMIGYRVKIDPLTRDASDVKFVEIREMKEKYPLPAAFSAYVRTL